VSQVVLLNGRFVPSSEARVSVHDAGWLHGAGLFETMRAEHGRVFRLAEHLGRLANSADKLLIRPDGVQLPCDSELAELLERNDLPDARVRLTLTAGDVLADREAKEPNLTVCVTAAPLVGYPDSLYATGLGVMIAKYRQSANDPLAGHKTTNFLPRLLAMKEANQADCAEALWFTPENLLAEGSITNVFVVAGGVVKTPPTDTPVLPGIARKVVIDLCAERDLPIEEVAININDLLDADEVFLTNVIMQVMPVVRVEKREIGDGKPGSVTNGLLERYRACVEKECRNDG